MPQKLFFALFLGGFWSNVMKLKNYFGRKKPQNNQNQKQPPKQSNFLVKSKTTPTQNKQLKKKRIKNPSHANREKKINQEFRLPVNDFLH